MGARMLNRFSRTLYRYRWPLALAMLALVTLLTGLGWRNVAGFSRGLATLGDLTNGPSASLEPKMFDSRYDIWFDEKDEGLLLYKAIEDQFSAEDLVVVAFEEREEELGVFSRKSLATISRLTAALEAVPGVRRVRSLTSIPWIRWGPIQGEGPAAEEGLLISDLVEVEAEDILRDSNALKDEDILSRIVAILGARGAEHLVSPEEIRQVIGTDADPEDFIGEPRFRQTLVSEDGRTAAILIQVLRPRPDEARLEEIFGDDERARATAPSLHAADAQWATLRGIDHVLRVEQGLAVKTPDYLRLQAWIAALPPGDRRESLEEELRDPRRNFMDGEDGRSHRKYFEYRPRPGGGYVDLSDPKAPILAPADFQPSPRSDYAFHVAGNPVSDLNFFLVGMGDMKMVGLVFLLIAAVLLLLFRRVLALVTPLVIVFATILGMLGTMWILGDLFNNLTACAPTMMIAVAIADSVHLLATYYSLRGPFTSRKELITEVIRHDAVPVLLTSVTTAIGFFSLTLGGIVPVRMLGYTAGIGTLFAYALSMTVVPAALSLLPAPRSRKSLAGESVAPAGGEERNHWGDRLTPVLIEWRTPILLASGLLVAVSLWGVTQVELDSDFRKMFPEDNKILRDTLWVEGRLGGVGDLEIVFEAPGGAEDGARDERQARIATLAARSLGHPRDPIELPRLTPAEVEELERLREGEARFAAGRIAHLPAFLTEVDRFERRLADEMADSESPLQVISSLLSPLDVLRKIHQVQNENRADHYRVPGEDDVPPEARRPRLDYDEILEEWTYTPPQRASNLVAQYYLQYESGTRPADNLTTEISADRRSFRLQARTRAETTMTALAAYDRIREIARTEFPRLAGTEEDVAAGRAFSRMVLSGKTYLVDGMMETFTLGYIRSMTVALVLITLIIMLIFRSPVMGLVSIVPNVLPIAIPLALFGVMGWTLDAPSVLVSSVALGICVDDTIHFLTNFNKARRKGLATPDALRYVFRHVGSALAMTTLVLVLGFGVLGFSQFAPNIMMGKLAVAMIGLAWVADFLVTPALLSVLPDGRPVRVRVAGRRPGPALSLNPENG